MAYGSALVDTIQSSTTGTPPQFNDGSGAQIGTLCRAWVNFNGTNGSIRASFNVSSVTRSGTGTYAVNLTNALTDANYGLTGAVGPATAGGECVQIVSLTTTVSNIAVSNNVTGLVDRANVGVSIFR